MKRILPILVCLVIVSSALLFPCLASTPADPYPFPFIIPTTSQNAVFLGDYFYSVSYTNISSPSFTFTYSDVEDFEQYDSEATVTYAIYPLFIDPTGKPISVPLSVFQDTEFVRLTRYQDGGSPSSVTISGDTPIFSFTEEDFDDGRHSYTYVFSFNGTDYQGDPDERFRPAKVAFVSIPLSNTAEYISTINLSYDAPLSYGQGYTAGYDQGELDTADASWQDGYEKGAIKGRNDLLNAGYLPPDEVEQLTSRARLDGKAEGFALGEQSDVTRDIKSTILYTVSAPFIAINNALQFEVLGVNLASLFFVIFTCVILAFVLKKLVL